MSKKIKNGSGALAANDGLGLGLMAGNQEVTLAGSDATLTILANPDLSAAHSCFEKAAERAKGNVAFLDFSNDDAAASSMSILLTIYDAARREADQSLTEQYEYERARLQAKKSSWTGEMAKLQQELELLENELRLLGEDDRSERDSSGGGAS